MRPSNEQKKEESETLTPQTTFLLGVISIELSRPIHPEEKNAIKARLLEDFAEESNEVIAVQVALVVGRIAKFDWPRLWPNLVEVLGGRAIMMEEEEVERTGMERGWRQLRALLNLHQILKEMTRNAGRGAKLTFMEIGGRALFERLMDLWREGMDDLLGLLSAIGNGEADAANLTLVNLPDHAQPSQSSPRSVHSIRYRAEVAKWSLKIMAALVVYGFEDWSQEPMAITFYEILLDRFPYCLDAAFHLPPDTPLLDYIHSFNKVFGKLLVTSQQDDSRAFLSIAQPALNFALAQIQSANHTDDVAVKCMKLVTFVIVGMGAIEDYKDNPTAIDVLGPVFDAQVIAALTHTLIHTYFTFTYQELEEWSDSPESSHHTQLNCADADDWSRSRAESLFLALLDLFPDIVIPIAMDHIQSSIQVLDAAIQWLHEEHLLGRSGVPLSFIEVTSSSSSSSSSSSGPFPPDSIPPHVLEAASPEARAVLASQIDSSRRIFFDPSSAPTSPLANYFHLDNILLRDASLHTICAANYQFFRHIDFADLFVNALQKEMYLLSQVVLPPLHPAYSANGGISSSSYDHNDISSGNNASSSSSAAGGVIPSAFDYRKSIIKRRVCLLIGKWVTDIPEPLRPIIYNLVESVVREGRDAPLDDGDEESNGASGNANSNGLTALAITLENGSNIMNHGTMLPSHLVPSDPAVALMSVWALECLVNEFSFEPTFQSFEPLIDTFVASIFGWLARSKMAESQLKILSSIGILVEGIAGHVRPYSFRILDLLVQLWDASGDELLMQSAVIRTIGKLVVAFSSIDESGEDEDGGLLLNGGANNGASSKPPSDSYENFYSRLIPIIDYSTKVVGRSSDNGLLEEGILLWLCTLRSATHFSQSLLDLFSNLPSIINGGMTEVILQMCIKLVESYVLLGQVDFLHAHVDDLAFIFSSWIGDTKDNLTHEVVRPLEMMLMLYPSEMPVHLEGFLIKVLQLIASGTEGDIALCYYVHFFNRVLLHNPDFFLGFLERCAEPMETPDLLTRFLSDFTIDRIDQLGDLRRRKLAAMALSNLLVSPLTIGCPDLVALALQTSLGIVCDEEAGTGPEYLVRPDETNLAEEIYVPELKRHSVQAKQLELLYASDPVNLYTGRAYVQQMLAQAQEIHPDAVNHVLSLVEPLVLETLYLEPSGSSASGDTDTDSED